MVNNPQIAVSVFICILFMINLLNSFDSTFDKLNPASAHQILSQFNSANNQQKFLEENEQSTY